LGARGKDKNMATPELRKLRHDYKAAYTNYMQCVQEFSDASQRGECPPDAVLAVEEKTLTDLAESRRALLQALCKQRSSCGP
jgi:hypothetical protein